MGRVLVEIQRVCDSLGRIQTGEFADPYTHGVAGIDQAIGAGLNPAISPIRIRRRPSAGTVNFSRLNRTITNGGAGKKPIRERERVYERFKGRTNLTIRRRKRAVEF